MFPCVRQEARNSGDVIYFWLNFVHCYALAQIRLGVHANCSYTLFVIASFRVRQVSNVYPAPRVDYNSQIIVSTSYGHVLLTVM